MRPLWVSCLVFIGVTALALPASATTSDTLVVTVTVLPDTTPPSGSVQINAGAAYTSTPQVTLTLAATDDSGIVAQMRFSHDNVTYTGPELYATTKAWTLLPGDGSKTIYVQFKDDASPTGNWSAGTSGSIILDTIAPSGQITSPQNGAVIGD